MVRPAAFRVILTSDLSLTWSTIMHMQRSIRWIVMPLLLLCGAGCGGDEEVLVCDGAAICAPIVLTVRGSADFGAPQVHIEGAAFACRADANLFLSRCEVGAGSGHYRLQVSALNYKPQMVEVTVPPYQGMCCGLRELETTLAGSPGL